VSVSASRAARPEAAGPGSGTTVTRQIQSSEMPAEPPVNWMLSRYSPGMSSGSVTLPNA
jgi:hypothetical protein